MRQTEANQRGLWTGDLVQLEADLVQLVPALGVGGEAMAMLRERHEGRNIYIGKKDGTGFLGNVAFFVALAAVQRGFPPVQGFEMGRAASEGVKCAYLGAQIYFPKRERLMWRDAWIAQAFNGLNASEVMQATGLTHRSLHLKAEPTARKRSGVVRLAKVV